jgi:hypothetical protein
VISHWPRSLSLRQSHRHCVTGSQGRFGITCRMDTVEQAATACGGALTVRESLLGGFEEVPAISGIPQGRSTKFPR